MRLPLVLSLLILFLFTAACASTSDTSPETRTTQASLETVQFTTELVDGSQVYLHLENASSRAIGANICRAELEIQEGDEWRSITTGELEGCVDEHVVINPGGEQTARFAAEELGAGTYRFTLSVELPIGIGFHEIGSTPFELLGTTDEVEDRIEGVEGESGDGELEQDANDDEEESPAEGSVEG